MAPVVGWLCDRIGARPVILTSLLLFGSGLIAAQAIGSQLWELYAFSLLLGIAAPGTNSIPFGLVVSRWFNRHRGMALGLMMIGIGAGAVVAPPAARILIASHGWRATYSRFGWAALLLAIPAVAIFLKEKPHRSSSQSPIDDSEGWLWRDIRGSSDFWLMIVVFVLVSASVQACLIHLAQIMADHGAKTDVAAFAASASGAALLIGRVATGYFLDRYSGPGVARVIFASAAVGIALLSVRVSGAMFAGAFLVGLGLGAEADIIAYLLGRHFGLRSFGTAFGFAFSLFVLAGGVGPLLMGFAFDHSGSYRIALIAFCIATALAAVLVGRLGPYRFGVKGEN
jgi:MFS family permease